MGFINQVITGGHHLEYRSLMGDSTHRKPRPALVWIIDYYDIPSTSAL